MRKVLVWGATDTVGGVEAVLWNYVSNIPKDKIQFDFINTYENISIGDKVKSRGSIVFSLPNRKKNLMRYRRTLKQFMQEHAEEYDVVWLNDCMFGNIDILKLAKQYHIPRRIIHAHNSLNMSGGFSRLLRHKINTWLLRFYVTDYWACSSLAGNWSYPKDIARAQRIKIIPNAVDVDRFSVKQDIREQYRKELGIEDKIVFGHVGRFHFQKNHIFLIDVFLNIHKLCPEAVLLLIGTGEDEEKVHKRVLQYGLEHVVYFLGTRKDTPELYQAMDAFVLPSLFEGLPVVMVEAQSSGLPCFVSDAITRESDISGNVEFYSLSESGDVWGRRIVEYIKKFKRENTKNRITESGYSIDEAAEQLMLEFDGD